VTTLVTGEGELRPVNLENVGPATARWLPWPQTGGSVPFDPGWAGGWQDGWWGGSYAAIYEAQPEVRICVDFLARNIAQIATRVLRRLADDDRENLYDHDLARTLRHPSDLTSRYWWQFGLVADLAIFDEAFNVMADLDDGTLGLARVPVPAVSPAPGEDGPTGPRAWMVRLGGTETRVRADQMFHVHGYNPSRIARGLAPLDSLAALLRESAAAQAERTRFWLNKAAVGGVIERPADAPKWSEPAKDRFRTDWDERFAGPENAGKTPVLEDGMTFKPEAFSPADAQWAEGRRLTREEVARAFHIPPPMVGILDHATFSNISEQHRMLYQDTLGPWLEMLTGEIERQLLPRFDDVDRVYVEFNIAAKLQGSFAEQVAAVTSAVGRPWMTGNEGRALQNLARIDTPDMDEVVLPLNVTTTGPGSAAPEGGPEPVPAPPAQPVLAALDVPALVEGKVAERWTRGVARARDRHGTAYEAALRRHFQRQGVDLGPQGGGLASDRWNRELSRVLRGLHFMTAEDLGRLVAERFEVAWDPELMREYVANAARIDADGINATTEARVKRAIDDGAEPEEAFVDQTAFRVGLLAATYATSYGMFGQREAATQGGLTTKVWVVMSPRSRHPSLNGQTAGLGEAFGNGAQYPGDPAAGQDQTSGCSCVMDYA
jgi:HK97 family phage portal protein